MMPSRDIWKYGELLEKLLRPVTFPLAIKFLNKEKDIPKEAKRPKKDYGYRMLTCQIFSESRRTKATIAQTKMDSWCTEAAIGFGFIEPIEYFLEGNTRYPEGLMKTWEAAKTWACDFPRLEYGKYEAILSAPLTEANFKPDLAILYCNSAQVTQLLMARTWIDGYDIRCRLSGQGACVHATVPVMQTGECQVTFPCLGDRRRAFAQDDEVIFSIPTAKLENLTTALIALSQVYGGGGSFAYPVAPLTQHEPEMLPSYHELARRTGMVE